MTMPPRRIKPEPTISVRWDNITAHQALMAVVDNYGLQLVEDPKNKIARITIQNPNVLPPLLTRVIQLKYAGVSNMETAVGSSLTDKRSKVMSDSRTSQLVVVATEKEQDAMNILVEQLDKPTRQVLIETKLVEVSSNPKTSKGIDPVTFCIITCLESVKETPRILKGSACDKIDGLGVCVFDEGCEFA